MEHHCIVTVLERKCFKDLQEAYLADPESGPCPCFKNGQKFDFQRNPSRDDFYRLGRECGSNGEDFPCAQAWDCISRYVYAALQGGSIMHKWTNNERLMIACCNDGTRPVVFKTECVNIPGNENEKQWLESQDFSNHAEDAYAG